MKRQMGLNRPVFKEPGNMLALKGIMEGAAIAIDAASPPFSS